MTSDMAFGSEANSKFADAGSSWTTALLLAALILDLCALVLCVCAVSGVDTVRLVLDIGATVRLLLCVVCVWHECHVHVCDPP